MPPLVSLSEGLGSLKGEMQYLRQAYAIGSHTFVAVAAVKPRRVAEEGVVHSRFVSAGLVLAMAFFAIAMPTAPAISANIKLLAGTSMRTLLPDLISQFEKSSGNKVEVEFGTLGANADRATKGEGDVAVITDVEGDKLQRQGKLIAGSPVEQMSEERRQTLMSPEDLVDAALAGLDQGELITIPPLADRSEWDNFEAARVRMTPHLRNARPAQRYHVR